MRMRTIIIVQEVEVHRWLLSGSEEDYILSSIYTTNNIKLNIKTIYSIKR